MAIPILETWRDYFTDDPNEGLGSSYERIVLNNKLNKIVNNFDCKSFLEVPAFGFTGVSGINSMELARIGLEGTIIDNNEERVSLIKNVWKRVGLESNIMFQENFEKLEFQDNAFDFSWNFSALWFVEDIEQFLNELTRVTEKVILLCVPNRSGLGYLSQKYISGKNMKQVLNEEHIIPKNIIRVMKNLNWKLIERNYIDCPPWPDIGMDKRDFLKIFHLDFLLKEEKPEQENICILDYYQDKDGKFPEKMLDYYWLEKIAPNFIKLFWAHHKYLMFIPNE